MRADRSDLDLLAELVAFDSVSSAPNRPLADFVCHRLERPGITIDRDETDDGAKVSLVVRAGPPAGPDRGGLVLSGHLDVVPADEPEWASDPFSLLEDDDRCFARGACDMKGFVAIAMNILAGIDPETLGQPLVLLLTADEELGSLGAQRLVRSGLGASLPRSAVIGEPTSLEVVRMHKGHLTLRWTSGGRSAHSGSPHLGVNAIERAARVVEALGGLRRELEEERSETSTWFETVPYPVLNVARIAGGTALNVIPDACTVDVGVRLLPGGDPVAARARVQAAVDSAAGSEAAPVVVLNDNPPMLLEEDAPIHRDLCALVGQGGSRGVSFASDAGVLRRDLDMECVLFGPGSIELAHRPNEFVPIAEMRRAREVVTDLVHRYCDRR